LDGPCYRRTSWKKMISSSYTWSTLRVYCTRQWRLERS
jgi:hypothetical protein